MPPIPARYPVNSPIASAEPATTAIRKGLRSTVAATHTAAKAPTGANTSAAPIKARKKMLVYPTLSILKVPVLHSTPPLIMKAALIISGLKRARDF